jgi:hypothetical protein
MSEKPKSSQRITMKFGGDASRWFDETSFAVLERDKLMLLLCPDENVVRSTVHNKQQGIQMRIDMRR